MADVILDLSTEDARRVGAGEAVTAWVRVEPQPYVPRDVTRLAIHDDGRLFGMFGVMPMPLFASGEDAGAIRCPFAVGDVVGVREEWHLSRGTYAEPRLYYRGDSQSVDGLIGDRWRPAAEMSPHAIRSWPTVRAVLPPELRDGVWMWRLSVQLEGKP